MEGNPGQMNIKQKIPNHKPTWLWSKSLFLIAGGQR